MSYMTAPSNTINGAKIFTNDSITDYSKWVLEPYTGEELKGVGWISFASTLIVGEQFSYEAYMYDNRIGINGPISYSVTNTDNSTTDKATIDAMGRIRALKPGTIKIKITYPSSTLIWWWIVTIEESMEGLHFIKNRHYDRYAQVDDNDAPGYANNGGIMEIWPLSGENHQRWNLTHVGNGYYKIASQASGYVITVPAGKETNDNVDLVLKPYTGSNNQKWRITLTSHGSYKIKAKSSESYTAKDLVMDMETSIFYTDGLNVRQRDYVDNTSYRDEWILEPYSVIFYGVTNLEHDHSSALSAIQSDLLASNWNSVVLRTGAISSSRCKSDLLSTNIFTSRSHGQIVLYSGTTNGAATCILLNDKTGSEAVRFYSHSWSGMNSGDNNIASNENYSNVDIALFIGCETAYGGVGQRNLPTSIVNRGATASVGFTDNISCNAANTWTTNFYSKMRSGATLEEAVEYACNLASESSGLKSAVICGDGTIIFPQ